MCPCFKVANECLELFIEKKEISEGQGVLVACKINNLLNQLIIMLNGLCRKVHDYVTVLVLPAMLVLG
jgi:hypothetical protein